MSEENNEILIPKEEKSKNDENQGNENVENQNNEKLENSDENKEKINLEEN